MKKILIAILILMMMTLSGCNSFYWKENISEECVKEKWIKGITGKQKYLVGMESGEVYQITDTYFKWQFRSSDIYNRIEEGTCYDITYFGFRSGILSIYKTICSINQKNKEIEEVF